MSGRAAAAAVLVAALLATAAHAYEPPEGPFLLSPAARSPTGDTTGCVGSLRTAGAGEEKVPSQRPGQRGRRRRWRWRWQTAAGPGTLVDTQQTRAGQRKHDASVSRPLPAPVAPRPSRQSSITFLLLKKDTHSASASGVPPALFLTRWNQRMNAGGVQVVRNNTPGGVWPSYETAASAVRHGLCGGEAGDAAVRQCGTACLLAHVLPLLTATCSGPALRRVADVYDARGARRGLAGGIHRHHPGDAAQRRGRAL